MKAVWMGEAVEEEGRRMRGEEMEEGVRRRWEDVKRWEEEVRRGVDVMGTFPWSSALNHPGDETKLVSKASEVKRSPIPQRCT